MVTGTEVLEQPVHLDAGQRVEGAERLVEKEEARIPDQGPRQGRNDLLRMRWAGERWSGYGENADRPRPSG